LREISQSENTSFRTLTHTHGEQREELLERLWKLLPQKALSLTDKLGVPIKYAKITTCHSTDLE
jgi:hypothetical protein